MGTCIHALRKPNLKRRSPVEPRQTATGTCVHAARKATDLSKNNYCVFTPLMVPPVKREDVKKEEVMLGQVLKGPMVNPSAWFPSCPLVPVSVLRVISAELGGMPRSPQYKQHIEDGNRDLHQSKGQGSFDKPGKRHG